MIAQPSAALESPLLLMLPPVFVAQVRLHSGFQCWLLSPVQLANDVRCGLQGEKNPALDERP